LPKFFTGRQFQLALAGEIMKILLIEDDDALITLLSRSLSSQHHIVDAVKDGEMGWTYASTFDYNLIILDVMLPKLDGISLCKKLREAGYTTPILLLTAQEHTSAKVQGLDAGADDYVVKPFDINELIARVRALLRRGSTNPLPLLSWGDLMLNPSTCDVTYDGQLLTLTTKEYDLLELFLRDSYHVFSSDEIIDRLWSSDDFPAEATVRSHLRRLRRKLQSAGAPPDLIGTIHGRGYYLKSSQPNDSRANILNNISEKKSDNMGSLDEAVSTKDSQELDQQYLAFLQETWTTTKTNCLEQLTELAATVDRLLVGNCTYIDQQQAYQQAHKLVGTLGVFYLLSAMEIAREIECLLKRSTLLSTTEATVLPSLVSELIQAVTVNSPSPEVINSSTCPRSYQSVLLLIDLDPALNLAVTTMAQQQHCQTITLSSDWAAITQGTAVFSETAEGYLTNVPADSILLPTVVLISMVASDESNNHSRLDLINNIYQKFPHWSILVLSDSDRLTDRLAVVQNGGKFLAINALTNEQIFAAATSLFRSATNPIKVMVVDDDLDWLRALPQLLKPWDINVTTLADLPQFWMVLQLVQPDVLILDIHMPEINGFELCQILRGDPNWQYLPILFLTAANDSTMQQQAFRVGADDYLCKPILGDELAQRVRHRLSRFQAVTYSLAAT
jgi:DNA-binding response OmpR family regulator